MAKGPQGREPRVRCLYPGLLRLIFPERSFVPLSLAARIVNLSSGGALIVLHQGHVGEPLDSLRGCYFELRIASANAQPLYGRVARVDPAAEHPVLGLRFHRAYPELIGELVHGESSDAIEKATLPLPILAPYSPLSGSPAIRLRGKAEQAGHLIVQTDMGKAIEFPIIDEAFDIRLDLPVEGDNSFRLIARKGEESSRPLTVTISYVPSARVEVSYRIEAALDSGGREVVDVELSSPGSTAGKLLAEVSKHVHESARVRFQLRALATEHLSPAKLQELRLLADRLREERETETMESA